ncbi:triose-phosphate isomerase [Blattabacterium cuenoti]|uniref:triose-phosphate isomerase n=1 Tax=Blattabacterium cuenoti TaxID=1653831 RepID=UPI00293BF928|nr:triose-phosphate isomerase [Blattabacterium cuenoti]
MRIKKKIVIANWKMNHGFYETTSFIRNFMKKIFEEKINHKKKIIIAPSFPFLHIASQIVRGTNLQIAAQNISFEEKGAYTGEVSAYMLKSIGINYVLIGHSERRKYFLESKEILLKKIKIATKHKINVIFCLGETGEERNKNQHFSIIKKELYNTIFHCSSNEIDLIHIAYEPIWAIGTNKTATTEECQEIHQFIRNLLMKKYGKCVSNNIFILYGGSINTENAGKIFSQLDVDGGLIGSYSLELENFLKIIRS